ncbi:MAG: DNA-binding protein [Proteobacteria bacterium]|nr:DNA-binding protein [Pseudomonadota bacterium]
MQAAEGSSGRVFVLRLEDGDRVPDCIEQFAKEKGVSRALVSMIGGIAGGRLVVGPKDGSALPIRPMLLEVQGVHEVAALGTLFPNETGAPTLHMHATLGRGGEARTGCVRQGLEVWRIGEVVIQEIIGSMCRVKDQEFGFEVLDVSAE